MRERTFAADRESVTRARRFVLESLTATEPDCSEIAVMVSELAANAVLHARTEFQVRVMQNGTSSVRVEVTDHGAGEPTLRSLSPHTRGGRGLRVVAALSDDWGTTRDAAHDAKTVWFIRSLAAADGVTARRAGVTTTSSQP